MKTFKNRIGIVALAILGLSYGAAATAVDLTFYRTAAAGEVKGDDFKVDQMFVGRAYTARICGAIALPCTLSAELETTVSITDHTGSFTGKIYVVTDDPIFGPAVLKNNIQLSYDVAGSLNLNTKLASGEIHRKNTKITFANAPIDVAAMQVFNFTTPPPTLGAPVFGILTGDGATLRIDITLDP